MKKLISGSLALLMFSTGLMLSACNTIQGAGEDIEAGGEAIQKCADQDGEGCKE